MTLHARVLGEGLDLVLIHGVTDSLAAWAVVAPKLAERARVHLVDLPGHGASAIPARPLSVVQMAEAVSGYLDGAGVSRCVVAGNSLGGGVTLAMCARDPARVAGAVVLGSIGLPFKMPWTLRALRWPGAAEATRMLAFLPHAVQRLFMRGMFDRSFRPGADVLDGYWSGWKQRGRARYVRSLMRVLDVAEPEPMLGAIGVPVHVVHGETDRTVPPVVATMLAQRIPGAALTLLPRCGHAPQLERPAETVAIIEEMTAR